MTSECICPHQLDRLLMIEYPGFVKNLDKALDTLGGLESIQRVNESQKERLELKFRKSDPLAHSTYGDRAPKKCLVVRIKRRKKKHRNGDDADEDEESSSFSISVVGKVQTSFRFDTLAEFQWLPMERTNRKADQIKPDQLLTGVTIKRTPESLQPEYASILDDVLPIKNPFDNMLKNFNPDAPMLILPAIFSRFDTPREIHQPHPKFRSKEMRDEFERQQNMSIIGRTRKKRSTMSYLLNYGDAVPEKPSEKLVERNLFSLGERSIVPKLKECFDRQKVWSKAALCFELHCTVMDVKYTLPLVAYHYLTGPFRTMWVKYGYDPHKDQTSKLLQTLDFRVKNPNEQQQEYSRRSIHQYQLPLRKNPEKPKSSQQLDLKSVINSASSSGATTTNNNSSSFNPLDEAIDDTLAGFKNMAIPEAMCKFRRGLVPPARQLSYQLKDIEIDEIQVIVHSNDGTEPEVCSERDGWLPEGSIDRIRKMMSKALLESVEQMTDQLVETT